MNKLLTLASALTLSASLTYADTISLEPGWNLLGAGTEQIDINATFAGKDVSLVWGFRNIQKEWIATSPDGTLSAQIADNNYTGFESVPTHMGYWVKNNSTASVELVLQYLGDTNTTSNPPLSEGNVTQGATYYTSNCASCHGADATGTANLSQYTSDQIAAKLSGMIEGNVTTPSGMTSLVSGLQAQDVEDLASYIGSLGSDSASGNTTIDNGDGTLTFNGVIYGTITSAETGRVWLDRNLGASQACTAIDDTACYGDYYQWGREADGHEKSDSSITQTLATGIENIGSDFVIGTYRWTTADSDGVLRSASWSKTDGTSVCPVGYRLPTKEEWDLEAAVITNKTDAFSSLLLPSSGYRNNVGDLYDDTGYYWSSTLPSSYPFYLSYDLEFNNSGAGVYTNGRSDGRSVRCIKAGVNAGVMISD